MRNTLTLILLFFSIQMNAQHWYGFGREMQELSSDITLSNTKLFPDSTVLIERNGELRSVQMHSVGQVFDPTTELFDLCECEILEENEAYFLDSIGFWYTYQRAQEFPDTLIIQFFKESNLELIPQPWPDWGGMESVSRAGLDYDLNTLRSPNPFLEVVEILDDQDITLPPLSRFKKIAIQEWIDANNVVAATITYYPGNPYNPGDTLEFDAGQLNQLNQFTMRHFNDYDQLSEQYKYNHGFMAHTCVRHGGCSDWEEEYISGNAWGGDDGRFFHADIRFKISEVTSTNEINELDHFQVFPNPTYDLIQIVHDAPNLNFDIEIFDSQGKLVYRKFNLFSKHWISLSHLEKGVYFLRASNIDSKVSEIKKVIRY